MEGNSCKREWDNIIFGCYGCWVMGKTTGNLDYVPEEEYSGRVVERTEKSAGNATARQLFTNKKPIVYLAQHQVLSRRGIDKKIKSAEAAQYGRARLW